MNAAASARLALAPPGSAAPPATPASHEARSGKPRGREREAQPRAPAPEPAQVPASKTESSPPPTPATDATRSPPGGRAPAPAPIPRLAEALAAQAAGEGTVQGAVLRHAAHLRIEAPMLGDLEVHLRIREGVAHLRVDGEAARMVEARAPELSRALAGEGLKLGTLDVPVRDGAQAWRDATSSGHRREDARREAWEDADDPASSPSPRRQRPRDGRGTAHGRWHVTA